MGLKAKHPSPQHLMTQPEEKWKKKITKISNENREVLIAVINSRFEIRVLKKQCCYTVWYLMKIAEVYNCDKHISLMLQLPQYDIL